MNTREPLEKILVIRLSSIGDVVQCSAIPRHLKRRFNEGQIHWVVRSDNRELLQFNPRIDRLVVFERKAGLRGWLALSEQLATEGYTHVYDAHNNVRSLILSAYLRFKAFRQRRPLQYLRRSKSRLKRFLLFWFKINLFAKNYTAVESYVAPLKAWQITYDHQGGELHVAPEINLKIKVLLDDFAQRHQSPTKTAKNSEGPWLALAPATAWPKKTWPLNHWQALVKLILISTPYKIVILGGPADTFCQQLVIDEKRVLNLQGKLSLIESAAVTPFCDTLVAADTGIFHMGEAMNKNVVGLLGPTPFGHPSRATSIGLQEKLWCQPCSKDGSGPCINREYQKCMKLIEPQTVFESIASVVKK